MFSEADLIYVVDDEASVRRSLGRLLRSLGLRSLEFASGAELLADERCAEASCILIDVHMPQMTGYELARRLSAAAPNSQIIFITALAEELDRWRTEDTSAIALLLKPFSEEELRAALRPALAVQRRLNDPPTS